jgi:hypothetical protein
LSSCLASGRSPDHDVEQVLSLSQTRLADAPRFS